VRFASAWGVFWVVLSYFMLRQARRFFSFFLINKQVRFILFLLLFAIWGSFPASRLSAPVLKRSMERSRKWNDYMQLANCFLQGPKCHSSTTHGRAPCSHFERLRKLLVSFLPEMLVFISSSPLSLSCFIFYFICFMFFLHFRFRFCSLAVSRVHGKLFIIWFVSLMTYFVSVQHVSC